MIDKDNNTPLHTAILLNQPEIVKAILETPGIDKQKLLESKNIYGSTPLHAAMRSNQPKLIKAILETDSIDKQKLFGIEDNNNSTPLYFILKHNKLELLKEILKESKDNPELLRKMLSESYHDKHTVAFLKPEDVKEFFNIKFSKELGDHNSSERAERETEVLKTVYEHLATYGANSWSGSAARIYNKVDALLRSQDPDNNKDNILIQKEVDRVLNQIINLQPKLSQTSQVRNISQQRGEVAR
jgi:ankyrin repeat protein